MSFVSDKIISQCLIFNDILFVSAHSEVFPRNKRIFYEVIHQLVGGPLASIGYCSPADIS